MWRELYVSSANYLSSIHQDVLGGKSPVHQPHTDVLQHRMDLQLLIGANGDYDTISCFVTQSSILDEGIN